MAEYTASQTLEMPPIEITGSSRQVNPAILLLPGIPIATYLMTKKISYAVLALPLALGIKNLIETGRFSFSLWPAS